MENVKKKSPRYSPEVRERAVRMVHEHRGEHESQWKVSAIAQLVAGFMTRPNFVCEPRQDWSFDRRSQIG
jgi:hypothetical protein